MKYIIALLVALSIGISAMLFSSTAFTTVEEDGLAVPLEAQLEEEINGSGRDIATKALSYGDVIYRSLLGYYVGEDRVRIDLDIPLYIDDGYSLMFWGEENALITTNVELYHSYTGLYLTGGHTYNRDLTQADAGEFILVTLPNGLYMNAQPAVFSGPLGEHEIPVNSILSITEEALRWYSLEGDLLVYHEEEAVFGATLRIGRHDYRYTNLLDALGLIRKAMEEKPVDEGLLEDAEIILNGDKDPNEDDGLEKDDSKNLADLEKSDEDGDGDKVGTQNRPAGDGQQGGNHTAGGGGTGAGGGNTDAGVPGGGDSGGGTGGGSGGNAGAGGGTGGSSGGDSGGTGSSSGSSGGSSGGGDSDTGGGTGSSGGQPGGGSTSGSLGGTPGTPGDGDGPQVSLPPASEPETEFTYTPPKLTYEALEPWFYALGLDIHIDDPETNIIRNIDFAVYGDKTTTGVPTKGSVTIGGKTFTTYPADSYDGTQTLFRRSYSSSSDDQLIALSTIEPGTTVYLEYSYRYFYREEKTEDGVTKVVLSRLRHESDLIEIEIPPVDQSKIQPVESTWNTAFAAHSKAMELTDLTLANHSNTTYDPALITKDFQEFYHNFKQNTLPYVSRYVITLTPADGGTPVVITTNQRDLDLSKAQQPGGTSFLSANVLDSNTKYTYTVQAQDAFQNTLPLIANGSTAYTGTLFTQKTTPTVAIRQEKVLNASGEEDVEKMKLIITLEDPDGALIGQQPLYLTMFDSLTNQNAKLTGTLDGVPFDSGSGEIQRLELPMPLPGQTSRTYEVVMDSLAYNFAYLAEVTGSVRLQPDSATEADGLLADQLHVTLGSGRFTTARLSDGLVHFATRVPTLRDTYGTISLEMQSDSTLSLLAMVDEFRVTLTGPDGFEYVTSATLDALSAPSADYTYVPASNTMEVISGSDANLTTGITLYGPQANLRDTPWESILVHQLPGDGEEMSYTTPMALWYELPKNLLQPNRTYSIKVEALAHKGGHSEPMNVKITGPTGFTTTKIIPVVHYSDMFLAADRAEFLGVWIEDPQNAILGGGTVQVKLSQGDNLLQMRTVTAYDLGDALITPEMEADYLKDGTIVPINLSFSGLSQGVEYKLEFIAPSYNETNQYSGLVPNKVMETRSIIGGSMLMGELNLTSLVTDPGNAEAYKAVVNIRAQDAAGYLFRTGERGAVYAQVYRADSMELPEYEAYGKPLELALTDTGDESCRYRLEDEDGYDLILSGLTPSDGWKIELYTYYQGEVIPLDDITFRTDGAYASVKTHKELYDALNRANNNTGPKNILVTADFPQEHLANREVNGIVDFQGHKVTKYPEQDGNYFLNVGKNGKVRNLAYEYPSGTYENFRAIFGSISGTVENLVVITRGDFLINSNSSGLIGQSLHPTGVLRNFIIQLGGDLIIQSPSSHNGAMFYDVYGVIENGYAYTVNRNDGFIIRRAEGGSSFTSGLLRRGATMRNVFFYMDSWFDTSYTSRFLAYHYTSGVNVENVYYVGDYYNYVENAANRYNSPMTSQYLLQASVSSSAYRNVWSIPTRGISNNSTAINIGTVVQLYETGWQKSVLNSAFDIDNTVPMEYFPRLNLPVEMQKYQNYVRLPDRDTSSAIPKIVDDGWAEDSSWLVEANTGTPYTHGLDSGYVHLTMENYSAAVITGIEITGLTPVTAADIVYQGQRKNSNLYDVVFKASVGGTKPQYYSGYKVTKLTYTAGGATREAEEDYVTQTVEFWKQIQSVYDWAAINDSRESMYWNYRVTQDLDFTGVKAADIVVDRPQDSAGNRYFRGKIHGLKADGTVPVFSNISITNSATPYVIYYLYNTGSISSHAMGEVKDLYFANLTLSAAQGSYAPYTGVVGYNNGGRMENILVKNASITGQGYMGTIAGYASGGLILHCAAMDSSVVDIRSSQSLYCGGLVGCGNSTTMEECYTRNVNMLINKTAVIKGVGGASGYWDNGTLRNCYTHGSIQISGNNVGGIFGLKATTWIERCWSYVDINQESGGLAAGIGPGLGSVTMRRCVALGDVVSSGTDICRAGQGDAFAYSGADVTGYSAEQKNDTYEKALTLLSDAQLRTKEYWQDTINMGAAFDYRPVTRKCVPLLAWDSSMPDWKQQDIPLPGTTAEAHLEVMFANYRPSEAYPYNLQLKLTHPTMSHTQSFTFDGFGENGIPISTTKTFHELIREQMIAANNGKGSFDGMDISEMALTGETPQSVLEVVAGVDEFTTIINIKTSGILKALDAYRVTVYYPSDLSGTQFENRYTVVGYTDSLGNPRINYWTIRTLYEWNEAMREHGQTAENFIIAGNIDFNNAGTIYNSLIVNRLEGEEEADGQPKWTLSNLKYDGQAAGNPWFEKCYSKFSGLKFQNMDFEFGYLAAQRGLTGVVQSASTVSNLVIDTVSLRLNQYARRYAGFFCDVSGDITNVVMRDVSLQDVNNGNYTQVYGPLVSTLTSDNTRVGALVGNLGGVVTNLTAEHIYVDMPYSYDVGGIAGRGRIVNGSITGLDIQGYERTGGMIGYWNAGTDCHTLTVTGVPGMNRVRSSRYAGGIANVYSNGTYQKDWHISGMEITASGTSAQKQYGHAAAFSSYGYGFAVTDSSVTDCIVRGTRLVGGLTGMNSLNARRCVVRNTDIIAENAYLSNAVTADMAAGGLAATMTSGRTVVDCVVQNCNIVSTVNAGGVGGIAPSTTSVSNLNRVYVDADTNVTAGTYINGALVPDGINAGGFIGYAKASNISYCASGALVQGKSNIGGAVGLLEPVDNKLLSVFTQTYVNATVLASENYAGGFVGRADIAAPLFTSAQLTDCLVAAQVSAPEGAFASAWINRTNVSGDAGNVELYIYENATVNGVTVRSVIDALQPGDNTTAAPLDSENGTYYTATLEQIQTPTFYTESLSFSAAYWDVAHLSTAGNLYMPYTTKYLSSNSDPVETSPNVLTAARIVFPEGSAGTGTAQLVVYSAGVNSVNVEGAPNQSVALGTTDSEGNAQVLVLDENGLGVLPFPASGTLTLGGQSYEVARNVMAYGSLWYYIDLEDGTLEYGDNTGHLGSLSLPNNAEFVHLWQGNALGSDGKVYALTAIGGNVSCAPYNVYPVPAAAPAIWNSGSVYVYSGFSLVNSVRLPDLRAFSLNNQSEYVHKDQAVYDGIILTRGGTTTYFGLLRPDGNLDPKAAVRFPSNTADKIDQISNTLGYTGQAMVIRYESGLVDVWDFVSGKSLLIPSAEGAEGANFFDFFMGEVMSLFSMFTDEWEDGYEESKQMYSGVSGEAFLGEDSDGRIDPDMEMAEEVTPTGEAQEQGTNSQNGSGQTGEDGLGAGGTGGLSGTSGQSPASSGGNGGPGGAAGSGGSYVSGAARGEALRSALGDTIVAYSPETGRYEQLDTAVLAQGDPEKAILSRHAEQTEPEEAAQKNQTSDFQVKQTGNRSLNASEKQGVTMLVVTASAAGIGLLALALFGIRKRRKK